MKSCHRPCGIPDSGQRGFTLTELLIAVAIIGILAALAAPSFSDLIKSQRVKSVATDIMTTLALARSEAIKRNANVTIAPVTAGSWASGWMIGGATVQEPLKSLTVTGPDDVTYRSSGRIQGNVAPAFDISAPGSTAHRCVTVDLSGRPYAKDAAC